MKTSLAAVLALIAPLLLVCHSASAAPVGTDVQIRTHDTRQLLKMFARAQETPSEVRRGLLTMFASESSEDGEDEAQESSEKRSGPEPSGDEKDEASSEERRGLLVMFAAEPPGDDEETANEER